MGKTKRRARYGMFPQRCLNRILGRLPVKSLLRFKSVSKYWGAKIESSSFINLHTTVNSSSSSSSSNKFGSFILLASVNKPSLKPHQISRENSLIMLSPESESGSIYKSKSKSKSKSKGGWLWWRSTGSNVDIRPDYYEDQVFSVVDNNLEGGSSNEDQQQQQQLVLKLDSLGVPSCYERCYFFKRVVGACNGLVCLYDNDVNKASLWNPATKQHRVLPRPIKMGGDDWPRYLVAFGFDVETKDYKVVILAGFRRELYRPVSSIGCLCRVQVYSSSTDSWRLLKGITCLPGDPFRYPSEVLYLNGSCVFMAHFFRNKHRQPCVPDNDRFLISFDLTKEIITPIQLPDHHRDQELFLSCLDDQMALFTVRYQPRHLPPPPPTVGFSDDYTIWALLSNEHGSSSSSSSSVNKDSWTKLHSFQIAVERPDKRNIPTGISNDGKFALLQTRDSTGLSKKMLLYHLESKEVKRDFLSCGSVTSKAFAYQPSLVSVTGGNGTAY